MLYLIGTGISGELSGEAIKACLSSKVYLDAYTCMLQKERLSEIKDQIKSTPIPLARNGLEEGAKSLARESVSSDIAILVPGDPLMATTHKTVLSEAKKAGATWCVIHSSSISSAAIGESMLDFYKFGRVATVPAWSDHYKPTSFYEIVSGNAKAGMHTLLLFDYDSKKESSLSFGEAYKIMALAEKEHGSGVLSEDSKAIFLHNIGIRGQAVKKGRLSKADEIEYQNGLNSIIIPSDLSYIESELTAELLDGEW